MEKTLYQYKPFQDNASIRILTLDAGKPRDPLAGTLEAVSINHAGSYEAMSYVWADAGLLNRAYEILIRDDDNKERLLKLEGGSIFAALCQLRFPDRPRRLWADQCCINQQDQAERSQQLHLMNRIFQDAAHVLVWLGLDTKQEAVTAFDLVHVLDKALGGQGIGVISHNAEIVSLERDVTDGQMALQALTNRPWGQFKRGWVAQEIGTRTPATMFWGDAAIDWDTLASVCERLKSYHDLRSRLGIMTSDVSFLFRRFTEPNENTHHANRFNFVYELQRSRHLRFTDDKDRIFAFLGHFSLRSLHHLGCGPISIVPDYTKAVEQTYIDVAVQILGQNPATICILLAAVQHARHSLPSFHRSVVESQNGIQAWLLDEDRLPSWVPDWRRSEGIILAEPICPHRAHGDSSAKLEIVKDKPLMLRVHGMKIDIIEDCSGPLLAADFYNTTTDQPFTTIERLWHDLCRKEDFNLNDKYLNGQEAFFAFMQTLSNGCVQDAGHYSRSYQEVSDRVWLSKAAKYVVKASDNVSEELEDAARGAEDEGNHQAWSRWATSASEGRVFARTKREYFVLGPAAMEAGDLLCVLLGCKVPFCLRPVEKCYLFVGECYVHGLMNGEAMSMLGRDELHEEPFDIL